MLLTVLPFWIYTCFPRLDGNFEMFFLENKFKRDFLKWLLIVCSSRQVDVRRKRLGSLSQVNVIQTVDKKWICQKQTLRRLGRLK